ncbi:MAG: hypothetical protein N3A54_05910, partial [Patescibacteria group bacterium]|nr:hypothetical protein [Patescibacteria group bacterium]
VLPFYYDWRKQPLDTAPKLKTFINQNTAQNERVHIVGHSMGGLIARAYIEREQHNAKVDKGMTVVTPHRGSTDVYRIWSGGEVDTGNPLMNFGILLLRQSCRYQHRGLTNKDIYRQNIPSLATFIPTYPFLRDARTNILKPLESLEAKNPWLLENSSFAPPYYGFTIGTLSGNNRQTKTVFKVREPSFADRLRGVWLDGRPTGIEFEQSGDGLVRHISSMLQNADNRIIQETHSGIVTSNQGIQEILSFLRGAQNVRMQASQSSEEPVSILGFVSTNGDFTVQTKQKTHTSERGFLAFVNPSDDMLTIRFPRKVSQGRFFIIHVAENAGDAIDYDIHNVSSNPKRLDFKKHKPLLELKDQR